MIVRSEIGGICCRSSLLLPLGVDPPAISTQAVWRVPLALPPPLTAEAVDPRRISRRVST